MDKLILRLSQRYEAALRANLQQGPRAAFRTAHALGRQAVVLGLETLDIARIHENALRMMSAVPIRNAPDTSVKRAQLFFAEAILPIEKTHQAAQDAKRHLKKLVALLRRSTVTLTAYNRRLKQGIARRKTVEKALKKSGDRYAKLLTESIALRVQSRRLIHKIVSNNEDQRGRISRQLYDEVAQTLLGINVKLVALKHKSTFNLACLRDEIASTQRLVTSSGLSLDFGGPAEPRPRKAAGTKPAALHPRRSKKP